MTESDKKKRTWERYDLKVTPRSADGGTHDFEVRDKKTGQAVQKGKVARAGKLVYDRQSPSGVQHAHLVEAIEQKLTPKRSAPEPVATKQTTAGAKDAKARTTTPASTARRTPTAPRSDTD